MEGIKEKEGLIDRVRSLKGQMVGKLGRDGKVSCGEVQTQPPLIKE